VLETCEVFFVCIYDLRCRAIRLQS
jgi:hypothetical protein